jgi:uncharacterized protein (TIGR00730 family)
MKTYFAHVPSVTGCGYDKNNVLITASASASASSNISYSRAYDLAYNLALQNANDLAQSLVNTQNIYIDNNNKFKIRVGFFCSASQLLSPEYYEQLNIILKNLPNSKYVIIYGGGKDGIMGQVGQLAINNHLSLYAYDSIQFNESQYSQAYVKEYDSLVPRENALINNTDISVILPGAYGTLMELFWMATLNNVGETQRKIIIWNINNYYTLLIKFLTSKQFQQSSKDTLIYNKIIVCNTYEEVLFNIKNNV